MDPQQPAPPGLELNVSPGLRRYSARYRTLTLHSAFQPIFSISHMRAVGYEGLLRAHDTLDRAVPPLEVFGEAARQGEANQLDQIVQTLHLENFKLLETECEWLFLNVQPTMLIDPQRAFLANWPQAHMPARRIVLEIMQAPRLESFDKLADSIAQLREAGFSIALDNFGAGHSNIEQIWQLNPDIVKIDRSMLAAHHTDMGTILPGLVALLHEAGKLVLIEGIETEHEAQLALACDADFVQGILFGRPHSGLAGQTAAYIGELTERYRQQTEARERSDANRLAPYLRAFRRAAERLAAGEPLEEVCWNFLALDHATRCYLLDANGRQLGRNIVRRADLAAREIRFLPLADAQGANWVRRPYFRSAISSPEQVHATKPYLSINEALPCVTLSFATQVGAQLCVLCGDIDWVTPHTTLDE